MILEHQIGSPCQSQKKSPKWDYRFWKAEDLWLRTAYRLLGSSSYTEEKTEQILKTDPETASLTGWPRIYAVSLQTVINWIKNNWRIFLQIKRIW